MSDDVHRVVNADVARHTDYGPTEAGCPCAACKAWRDNPPLAMRNIYTAGARFRLAKKLLLVLCLIAAPAFGTDDAPLVDPTPVTITADDVYELQAEQRQEKLEGAIRRDLERVQNWSNDNDD